MAFLLKGEDRGVHHAQHAVAWKVKRHHLQTLMMLSNPLVLQAGLEFIECSLILDIHSSTTMPEEFEARGHLLLCCHGGHGCATINEPFQRLSGSLSLLCSL